MPRRRGVGNSRAAASQNDAGQGAAVAGQGVAAGGEPVLERFADLVTQQRQDVGGVDVGQIRGGDFEYQLANLVVDGDKGEY
ncbi:hypothetical protein [Streptomyces sp. NPDC059753]|uniref:hypothetical protein n=1 Tax=Streptomyces sp. NPDC059753 TaxID=3346933 RepID=UPI00364EE083